MRIHFSFAPMLVIGAVLSIALTGYAGQSDNLLQDGGFESGITGWGGYPSLPIHRSKAYAHRGEFSLPFPQGEKKTTGMLSGVLTVEPGATYEVSLFARGQADEQGHAGHIDMVPSGLIYRYDRSIGLRHANVPVDRWERFAFTFTNPRYMPYFALSINTQGKIWIDDIAIVKTADATPLAVSVDLSTQKIWYGMAEPIDVACLMKNSTDQSRQIKLTVTASLPGPEPIDSTYPLSGYSVPLKQWETIKNLPAHQSLEAHFMLQTEGLPETGILLHASVTGDGIQSADSWQERFICVRPVMQQSFLLGAQYYKSDRFSGKWLLDLQNFGIDSVRETVPLPMSYRNNVPGKYTGYPLDLRLGYYARRGIHWLTSLHTVVNNMPGWLMENPQNRLKTYDGKIVDLPRTSYFPSQVRQTAFADAQRVGALLEATPEVHGVQVDNEIGVIDDYSDAAQQSFRDFLLDRFKTVKQLNKVLDTQYDSFDQIQIPIPLQSNFFVDGSWGLDVPQDKPRNIRMDFLWLTWREKSLVGYYRDWTAHFKKAAPHVPVGHNFYMAFFSMPRIYYACPINPFRFADIWDAGGVDATPCQNGRDVVTYQMDWLNSAWQNRSLWVPESSHPWSQIGPYDVGFDLFFYAGRKVQYYNFFNWPVLQEGNGSFHDSGLSYKNKDILKSLRDAIGQIKTFDQKYDIASLEYISPSVGIYFDSDIFNYAILQAGDSSVSGSDSVFDMQKLLRDLHYDVRLIDGKTFGQKIDPNLKALFVSGCHVLSREKFQAMLDYAHNGGVLFLNGATGDCDENLQRYDASPCDMGSQINMTMTSWSGGKQNLLSQGEKPEVKLGKNRMVRGFGHYGQINTQADDWRTLMWQEDGQPGLLSRSFGKGTIYWSRCDIAAMYGFFRKPNTRFLVEGILENHNIGRFVSVRLPDGQPASDVAVAIKQRKPGQTFVFLNNFGKDQPVKLYINTGGQPIHAIHDVVYVEKQLAFGDENQCATLSLNMHEHGYHVLRIDSQPVAYTALPAPVVQQAPGDLALDTKPHEIATVKQCSLTQEKTDDGKNLLTIHHPYLTATIAPDNGGRIVSLSIAGEDTNQVLSPLPPTGPKEGGIKTILSEHGESFPGLALDKPFTVLERLADAQQVKLAMRYQDPASHLSLTNTYTCKANDPALYLHVNEQSETSTYKTRLYLHAAMLLGNDLNRNIKLLAGQTNATFQAQYQLGKNIGLPVKAPVQWGALVNPDQQTAFIVRLLSGFDHVNFWNGATTYNLEACSALGELSPDKALEGKLAMYLCKGLSDLSFVMPDLAGSFAVQDQSAGLDVVVRACSLTGQSQKITFVLKALKSDSEKEFGTITLTAQSVKAQEKKLSLGGIATGFDIWRLYQQTPTDQVLISQIVR
jgi:hypothetical protein